MNILKKFLAGMMCVMLLTFVSIPVLAEITPHENDDEYYEEETVYDDSSSDSYDNTDSTGEETNTDSENSSSSSKLESSASSRDTNVSQTEEESSESGVLLSTDDAASSGADDEAQYIVFGTLASKSNDISGNLGTLAYLCIGVGAVGLLCIIVWSIATRGAKSNGEVSIYQTVGEAQRNNAQTQKTPPRPRNAYDYNDNYSARTRPQNKVQQRPTPPVNRQAQGTHARTSAPQQQRVATTTAQQARRTQTAQQHTQPTTRAASPRTQQAHPQTTRAARSTAKFDTDEILKEFLK